MVLSGWSEFVLAFRLACFCQWLVTLDDRQLSCALCKSKCQSCTFVVANVLSAQQFCGCCCKCVSIAMSFTSSCKLVLCFAVWWKGRTWQADFMWWMRWCVSLMVSKSAFGATARGRRMVRASSVGVGVPTYFTFWSRSSISLVVFPWPVSVLCVLTSTTCLLPFSEESCWSAQMSISETCAC